MFAATTSRSSADAVLTVAVLCWLLSPIVGAIIGARKGRGWTGFFLGLFLFWMGLLIIAVLSPTPEAKAKREGRRPCPSCAELIRPGAVVCPHCGRDVTTASGVIAPPNVADVGPPPMNV